MRKTAFKFTKLYSYISKTKAHHIKLKFCTVIVHINTDILVEFHFDSCESYQDMAFSAMLPQSTRSKLSSEMMFISLSLFDPSDSPKLPSQLQLNHLILNVHFI